MLRCVLTLCWLTAGALAWLNDFDQPVNFQCPPNQFLSHLNSIHNNHAEDRVWDFGCSPLPLPGNVTAENCNWTNDVSHLNLSALLWMKLVKGTYFVNQLDQPQTFQCPNEGFIAGIASEHDNHAEDRRFKFRCCEVAETMVHSCHFTNWANVWDGPMDFIVPSNKILRGVDSFHDNGREDRRFKFEICDIDFFSQE